MPDPSREIVRPGTARPLAPPRRPAAYPLPGPPPASAAATSPPPAPAPPRPPGTERLATGVSITHERTVTGELAEQLWASYVENFTPLEELALYRHLDPHDVIIEQFANPRILKLVAWHDAEPIGLGMVTSSLDEVVEISPRFLRARYPDEAARDAIFYGTLVMVSPGVRGLTVFNRIYIEMWQVVARAGGVLAFDVCDFNRNAFDADAVAQRIAAHFPNGSVELVDRQHFYVARLPEPIPDPPSR